MAMEKSTSAQGKIKMGPNMCVFDSVARKSIGFLHENLKTGLLVQTSLQRNISMLNLCFFVFNAGLPLLPSVT